MGLSRRERRTFGLGRGTVDLFLDNDDLVMEGARSIMTTTAQNVVAKRADLSFLGHGTPLEDRAHASGTPLRNESLVYIDKRTLDISILTDPIGFSKIFHLRCGEFRLIASSIEPVIPLSRGLDLGSVGSFVVNGAPLNNRTIFDGIATLARASLHRLTAETSESTAYWRYAPTDRSGEAPARLQTALWQAIVESIRSQCEGKRVLLPLSGGFDSSVILGVLGKILNHRDVTCFSYTNGRAVAGSDAHVAKQQAAVFGYPHFELDISGASLADVLEKNREAGQSQRGPSLEITAYTDLKRLVGADDDTIMPFGDEFFGGGWSSYRLTRRDDLLGAVYLRSSDGLKPLQGYMTSSQYAGLKAALDKDYRAIVAAAGDERNWPHARELLYLDQRIGMNLLPLRTFSVGHWFDVCAPLLDTSVIDQIALLPPEQRKDKTFFKDMAHAFLPDIFENTRSSHRQAAPVFAGSRNSAMEVIAERALREGWQIPGVLETDDIVRLIGDTLAGDRRANSLRSHLEAAARKLMSKVGVLERARSLRHRYASPFDERPDRMTLLARVLSLAQTTRRRPD